MRRIFIKDILKENITITGADAHHLGHVMRSRVGDKLVVADDAGSVAEMEITGFTSDTVELKLISYVDEQTESNISITLVQCLPKGDKLELIVQKATELGVNVIVPLMSRNCVVKYDGKKAAARQEKWQKIANEAGKQCGRSRLPVVEPIKEFSRWLEYTAEKVKAENISICMCYENEIQVGIKEFLCSAPDDVQEFFVIIGPEGGFSLDEAELARSLNIPAVSLGRRILRAETAAISAVSVIQYEKGDLGGDVRE